jgi:hypothetical protein
MSDNKTEEKYKKLFGYVNLLEPPMRLIDKVSCAIREQEKSSATVRFWAFGGTTAASFGLSLWAVINLIKSFKETGFWQYLSLIFSENSIALTYWKEISFSLAESLPVFGLIIFLSGLGFFVWSITKINYNKKYEFQF